MAYNYGFPATYNPMPPYYQPPLMQTQQTQTPTQQQQTAVPTDVGIIWVQGEAAAKSYPVARGNRVLLMDSEKPVFYLKETDVNGVPTPLKSFDYKEHVIETSTGANTAPEVDLSVFVRKDDFDALQTKIEGLQAKLEKMSSKPKKKVEVEVEDEDE